MGYRVYNVKEFNSIEKRTSTDGYQPKFLVDNRFNFIKVQCELAGVLRDDWRVEDIASRICKHLSIYAVYQKPCRVNILTNTGMVKKRIGVVSHNYEQDGLSFISFVRLLSLKKYSFDIKGFNKASNKDKLGMLIKTVRLLSGIELPKVIQYFYNMVTVDMLVLNQDRHFKNFGVFFNSNTNKMEIAKLFDFGMGLFENDNSFDNMDGLSDCMRYSYIEPFSEDPFVLFKDLIQIPGYKHYIQGLNLESLVLSKDLFLSDVSYEYYRKMRGEMLNAKY